MFVLQKLSKSDDLSIGVLWRNGFILKYVWIKLSKEGFCIDLILI